MTENIVGALLSVVFMGVIVYLNGKILMKQASISVEDETQTGEEFWLLRFPFSLQCGWSMTVFVMAINGFISFIELGQVVQLIFGFLSLAAYVGISWKMLFANGQKPNYAIPSVVAWVVVSNTFVLFAFPF